MRHPHSPITNALGGPHGACDGPRARGSQLAIGTDQIEPLGSRDVELAAMPYPVFVISSMGRIKDVNGLAEALTGYPRNELVGELLSAAVSHPFGSSARWLLDARTRAHLVTSTIGLRLHQRTGPDIAVEILLCPHERYSTLAIVRPRSAADLGLSDEALEQIVHDLESPLATVTLETGLLDDALAGLADSGPRTAVERITRNIAFVDRMVQDLLDACAIDRGQLELRRKPAELGALLARVIDRVVATRDRGRVRLDAPIALTLSVDELRIERVVASLVQNAVTCSPRSTTIEIRLEVEPGLGRISVSNAGRGMTAVETDFMFDKYRRTASARMDKGSGLGLYVSKGVVEAHGGRIGFASIAGVGSRLFVELPSL